MGEKVNVNWSVDAEIVALLKATVDRYNATHERKTFPGEVVAVAVRLLRQFEWVRQQQMIDHRDDSTWWDDLRRDWRGPDRWPGDFGPELETPGSQGTDM